MDSIDAALAALDLQETSNYTVTAQRFRINRTTLSQRHKGITAVRGTNPNFIALLSPEQRRVFIDYINELTK